MVSPERKTDRQLIDEATQWLVRLDAGTANEAEFLAWREADPRHSVAFAEAASAWRALGRLQGLDVDASAIDGASEPKVVRSPAIGRRAMLGGLAAGVAAAVAGGGGLLTLEAVKHSARTKVGERRTLELPDGSTAELNTDSRVRWSFDKVRAVWLEQGEMALTVVQDAARPFVVHVGDLAGSLQQGRYNVRLKASGPQFISLAGSGTIRGKADALVPLEPLRVVALGQNGPHADLMPVSEVRDAVAWQNGEIVFRGMALASAADEFNRYLQRKIVVDPSVAEVRLGGRFQVNDLPSFLSSLQGAFGIRVTSTDRGYLLTAA
jgi:transmembrane sensor